MEARCQKPAERTACDEIGRKDQNDHILEMHCVKAHPLSSPHSLGLGPLNSQDIMVQHD